MKKVKLSPTSSSRLEKKSFRLLSEAEVSGMIFMERRDLSTPKAILHLHSEFLSPVEMTGVERW